MAHVCYKANSNVCHTTPILDVAHDNVQQPAHNLLAVYKLAVHRAILLPDITSHRLLMPQPMMLLPRLGTQNPNTAAHQQLSVLFQVVVVVTRALEKMF